MNIGSHEIDENILSCELEQIISEDMPEQLFSWNEIGKETLIRQLSLEDDEEFDQEISYVPKAVPEMKDLVTWIPLVLVCANTVLQIVKERLLIRKELEARQTISDDETDEKTQAIEKVLQAQFYKSGIEQTQINKLSKRLAKTIIKAIR
jgi:hypothetical protein